MSPLWTLDAGGTTTTATGPGGRLRSGSVNPASVGDERAGSTLRSLFADLGARLRGEPALGWIATATLDPVAPRPELDRLRALAVDAGLRGRAVVSNDAVPWLVAPPLSGRGAVVVCGTGSGFLACDGVSAPTRVGGCEYLGSDEGSAFDIGLAGLRAAVRAGDGRGPATALAAAFRPTPALLARDLAARAFPKADVAALAPVVCRTWLEGDDVAASVVARAVDELVVGVAAAARSAGLVDGYRVAAGGGVLRGSPDLLAELDRALRAALPVIEVVPVFDPDDAVLGALTACARDGDLVLPPGAEGSCAWLLDLAPDRVVPASRSGDPAPEVSGPGDSSAEPRVAEPRVAVVPEQHASSTSTAGPAASGPVAAEPAVSGPAEPRPSTQRPAVTAPVAVGLCLAAWGGAGLDAAITAAAESGVDAVDLPTDTTSGLVDADRWADDADYRADLRAALRPVVVTCVSNSRDAQLLLGPHGPHTDPVLRGSPDEKRAHALRHASHAVRIAADLGAGQVRLMLGVPDLARWLSWWHSDVGWDDNIAAWREAADPLLDLAAEHGVELLVEPHPKQVAHDPPSTRTLLDAVAGHRASVRVCLDIANIAATGHDPLACVRGWGADLGAAHAKDLQRWTGADVPTGAGWSRYGPGPAIRFRALGSGDLPWPALIAALLDEDFTGVLYVEHEDALLPRRQGVANSVRLLRALLPDRQPQGRTW
ncbi:TIM barrel protein [Saccharothrix sp. ALI-22-I]|uniref:TIM barrel protein n=1 Tax=Saccharothrix sp. ALI-22-I TaxID=1933778 RepID=UPI000A0414E2|nr:TIM barrel protein [Saccharothrix sp. ALI-22-I]